MKETNQYSFLRTARNSLAAAALIPAGVLYTGENNAYQDFPPQSNNILEQVDDFVETDYGRVIAASLFAFSAASAIYRTQANLESDNKKKYKLSLASSGFFFALSSIILYESFGDADSKIAAGLLEAYAVTQSAYNTIDVRQRHKEIRKRLPAYAVSASGVVLSSAVFMETLK